MQQRLAEVVVAAVVVSVMREREREREKRKVLEKALCQQETVKRFVVSIP